MTETINVKIIPDESSKIIRREIVSLGLAIGASVILVLLQRKLTDPDFVLTVKMRMLNQTMRYADTRAQFWRAVSDNAAKLYLESRP